MLYYTVKLHAILRHRQPDHRRSHGARRREDFLPADSECPGDRDRMALKRLQGRMWKLRLHMKTRNRH